MRQTQTIILFFLATLTVKADRPGRAYQYDLYSQNEQFYFKSIPFHSFDQTNFGKTIVYNAKTKKKLYQIDNYLPRPAFLSNNGKTAITARYWLAGHDNFDDQEIIQFYTNGKKSKKYFVPDLISDSTELDFTVSHTLWYDEMFIHKDTLFILLLGDKVILIDINKAEIIGKKDKSFIRKRFDMEQLPQTKSIVYYKIKYPEGYQFPDLISGKNFRQELITGLRKTEVKSIDSCRFYISVYGAIDRKGNCEIFMLRATGDQEDDTGWKKQVTT